MRVLISAYGFSPYRGSECAVGWNIAKELSQFHDVTVITGDVKDNGFESEFPKYVKEQGAIKGLTVIFIKPTRLIRIIEKLHDFPGLWALYYVAYNLWQRVAFKKAQNLHERQPFDVVHHLTMIGYREPGYMWKLGIPFFWGPVGGSVNEPLRFAKIYSTAGKVKSVIRYVINGCQKRILMRPKIAAQKARKIWAVTSDDVETISKIWGLQCEQMIETAATQVLNAKIKSWTGESPLRLVWSGTHTYGKAMPILMYAIVSVRRNNIYGGKIQVDVLGKGDETSKWKQLAKNLGLDDSFNWIGYVSREKALTIMNDAHLLVFTSVKEGTPHVVLEALSLGLPVVCHDACGMGCVVNEKCGFKVPMINPDTSIKGFAAAISNVIANPEVVAVKSREALRVANDLTWHQKATVFSAAYKSL